MAKKDERFNPNDVSKSSKGYKDILKSITSIAMEHRNVKKLEDDIRKTVTERIREE